MRRNVVIAGAALVVPSIGLFAWKVIALGLPVTPSSPEDLWRVELEVHARSLGSGGSIRAAIPSTRPGQLLDDERVTTDRLHFDIRSSSGQRTGLWKGAFSGVHDLSHSYRVQLREVVASIPNGPIPPPPEAMRESYGQSSLVLPSNDPEVQNFLLLMSLRGPEDSVGRARTLLTFVADDLELIPDGTDDALLCLATRECGALGKERLLATLLRGVGTPARVTRGLRLSPGHAVEPAAWVETWLGGWVPLSASRGFFGRRPADLIAITHGDEKLVSGVGMQAISHRYRALQEQLSPEELAPLMEPASVILSSLSLYRLPVATQSALRLLLIVPLGALLLALARNVAGVPTFGTFLPVLLALALRDSGLGSGVAMLVAVLSLGWLGRVMLDRLHLLLVPRLCIILCLVVLAVTTLAVLGRGFEQRDLFAGVLFPLIILTMLIERFSISVAEEGVRISMVRLAWTVAVMISVYPLFHSSFAENLMFGYPELVFAVMGALVWIGGYTGYRLSELIRFRSLVNDGGGAQA